MSVSVQIINWKINLKNGQNLDLNVQAGDKYDKSIKKWVDGLAKKQKRFFTESFEQGSIWLSPDEFSMAIRSVYVPPNIQPEEQYAKIQENAPKVA